MEWTEKIKARNFEHKTYKTTSVAKNVRKRRKPQSSKKNAKYNIVYTMIAIIISNFKSMQHFHRSHIGKKIFPLRHVQSYRNGEKH